MKNVLMGMGLDLSMFISACKWTDKYKLNALLRNRDHAYNTVLKYAVVMVKLNLLEVER